MMRAKRVSSVVSIAVLATCVLASGVALAKGKGSPATYTCAELIEVDIEEVPQVVYWIDGYTSAGDAVVEEDVEWVPVEVETIIVECKKDPSQPAQNVIKKHRKSK